MCAGRGRPLHTSSRSTAAGGRVYAYPIDGGDSIELGQSPLNQLVIGPGDDEVLIRDNGMVWVSAATGAKRHIVLGGAQPPFIAAFAGGYESVWSEDRFVVDAQPNDTTVVTVSVRKDRLNHSKASLTIVR